VDGAELVAKAVSAKRESKYVEFKEQFDVDSAEAWCEIIKDMVAIANSGGGVIVIGLTGGGHPSGATVTNVADLDPAIMVDRASKYTRRQFTDFELVDCEKDGNKLVAITLAPAATPFVFEKPGTYAVSDTKQKTAFSQGTIYCRHGAKSEPATNDDLAQMIESRLAMIRRDWLDGVRKVVRAPEGSAVQVLPREVVQSTSATATPIKIVDDPAAPAYRLVDPDKTHPYRQKELLTQVNRRLPKGRMINSYDILVVRRLHGIDDKVLYCHCPKYASPQYSDAFVAWLVEKHQADNGFFSKARDEYYESHR